MLEVDTPEELDAFVGRRLGTSGWRVVEQGTIDAFAAATGDRQWIHVDVERARRDMPGGRTIAHGYLTLSLIPVLAAEVYAVRRRARVLNYGSDRVRFTAPVPAGARVRLHLDLLRSEPMPGGRRLGLAATMELEGAEKPALVAEILTLVHGS